ESINADLLERYFKQPHGNVYSLSANADINGPLERMGGREETHGAELRALAAAARETNLERLRARLPHVLHLPRFLSFMAVEVLLDHCDGYTFNVKNYQVYHDPGAGKMVFLPHDLDQVLRDHFTPVEPSAKGMVARAVLRDPLTRVQYRERFQEVYGHSLAVPVLSRRIDERVAQLAPQLKAYDPVLADELVRNCVSLKSRLARRAKALTTLKRPSEAERATSSTISPP